MGFQNVNVRFKKNVRNIQMLFSKICLGWNSCRGLDSKPRFAVQNRATVATQAFASIKVAQVTKGDRIQKQCCQLHILRERFVESLKPINAKWKKLRNWSVAYLTAVYESIFSLCQRQKNFRSKQILQKLI